MGPSLELPRQGQFLLIILGTLQSPGSDPLGDYLWPES